MIDGQPFARPICRRLGNKSIHAVSGAFSGHVYGGFSRWLRSTHSLIHPPSHNHFHTSRFTRKFARLSISIPLARYALKLFVQFARTPLHSSRFGSRTFDLVFGAEFGAVFWRCVVSDVTHML